MKPFDEYMEKLTDHILEMMPDWIEYKAAWAKEIRAEENKSPNQVDSGN